jgi:hypothetical protein
VTGTDANNLSAHASNANTRVSVSGNRGDVTGKERCNALALISPRVEGCKNSD